MPLEGIYNGYEEDRPDLDWFVKIDVPAKKLWKNTQLASDKLKRQIEEDYNIMTQLYKFYVMWKKDDKEPLFCDVFEELNHGITNLEKILNE